ncbi:hypothetical protein F5I97DRAFT_1836558 [Phlebopus sp. FC_14]|nr:hypothetical protein F5I97DRAFT_1836558 [Phlebopus sp. FC_14]
MSELPQSPPEAFDAEEFNAKVQGEVSNGNARFAGLAGLLSTVVKYSPDVLDSKYGDIMEALGLIDQNDDLADLLETALETKQFAGIRNLAILGKPRTRNDAPVGALKKSFIARYEGDAPNGFYEYLTRNNAEFHRSSMKYYAKFCSIVQSSGTGKSRLMMQMADKGVIVLYLNLRPIGDTGYPPRDAFAAKVLTENLPQSEREYGARCCAFFAAIFAVLTERLKSASNSAADTEAIVKMWNDGMCSVDSEARADYFRDVEFKYNSFLNTIDAAAVNDSIKNMKLTEEKTPFDFMPQSAQDILKDQCAALEEKLGQLWPEGVQDQPRVFIAYDEAHSLNETTAFRAADTVCRVISLYSPKFRAGVWVAFGSTTSRVADFSAPQRQHNSARVQQGGKHLFRPYTELGWDPLARDLYPGDGPKDVARYSHIVRFGRPLWASLADAQYTPTEVADLANYKLLGAKSCDVPDDSQALAILGQRFGLHISFGHPDAVGYLDSAVASYLRICIATTEDRIWKYTSYPSEPFLSCVAAKALHSGHLLKCLEHLRDKVNNGMIELGERGELASRLLWLLAKDLYVREKHSASSSSIFNHATKEHLELYDCQKIRIVPFFKFLFGQAFWDPVDGARQDFEKAYVNFSHWVSMVENISKGADSELRGDEWTLRHWCRTSAVQCCHGQPVVDKMIPIFFDETPASAGTHPNTDVMSQIFISDKNREKHVTATATRKDKSINCLSSRPYIFILCELAVDGSSLTVEYPTRRSPRDTSPRDTSPTDMCLKITARGLNGGTFAFLQNDNGLCTRLQELTRPPKRPSQPYAQLLSEQMKYGSTSKAHNMYWERGATPST